MKKIATIFAGTIFGLSAAASDDQAQLIQFKDLESQGIDSEAVISRFVSEHGISLSLNEQLKISYEEEGRNIRFDTFDSLSVVVPLMEARGAENKIGGGP